MISPGSVESRSLISYNVSVIQLRPFIALSSIYLNKLCRLESVGDNLFCDFSVNSCPKLDDFVDEEEEDPELVEIRDGSTTYPDFMKCYWPCTS